MANRRKPEVDIPLELQGLFYAALGGGAEVENAIGVLMDLTNDPGAWHTAGQLARIGAVLSKIGAVCTEEAKRISANLGVDESSGVFFMHRDPYTQQRVNTGYLKERFPAVNYPEMWTTSEVTGSVAIDLPFKI